MHYRVLRTFAGLGGYFFIIAVLSYLSIHFTGLGLDGAIVGTAGSVMYIVSNTAALPFQEGRIARLVSS